MSKPNKAERLANNIQVMLKSNIPRSLNINKKNEKAFQLAVKQLAMKLDEFDIQDDGPYLEIKLKRDMGKDTRTVLRPPSLPRLLPKPIMNSSLKKQ